MKVSIVVPIYNVEEYLPKCLDSLVNQSYDNIEILCVNDGSKDNSLEVIKEYKEKYKDKIVILDKPNGGLSDARNYGVEHSTGDYIGFVDADDWVHKNMYENMINTAQREGSEVVVCNYVEVYSDREIVIKDNNNGYKILYEALVCNKLFKRELFKDKDVKFPLGLWYEDNGTSYKLLFLANKISKLEEDYYFYRKDRPNSIMNSQKSNRIYDIYKIGDELYRFFSQYNITPDIQEQIEYLFIKNIFFRVIPKIILLEAPNPFKIKKEILRDFSYLESYFPKWSENKILIEDKDNYFFGKLGKNHINRIKRIRKNYFSLAITYILK